MVEFTVPKNHTVFEAGNETPDVVHIEEELYWYTIAPK